MKLHRQQSQFSSHSISVPEMPVNALFTMGHASGGLSSRIGPQVWPLGPIVPSNGEGVDATGTGDGVATGGPTGAGVTATGEGVTGAVVAPMLSQTAAKPVTPAQPPSSPHSQFSIVTADDPETVRVIPAQEPTSLQSSSSMASADAPLLMLVIDAPAHAETSSHSIFSSSVSVDVAVSSMVRSRFAHAETPLHSSSKSSSGSVMEMVAPWHALSVPQTRPSTPVTSITALVHAMAPSHSTLPPVLLSR